MCFNWYYTNFNLILNWFFTVLILLNYTMWAPINTASLLIYNNTVLRFVKSPIVFSMYFQFIVHCHCWERGKNRAVMPYFFTSIPRQNKNPLYSGRISKYLHCSNIAPPSATGADLHIKSGIVVGTTLAEMCQTTAVSQQHPALVLWQSVCRRRTPSAKAHTFVCTISKRALCVYDNNNLAGHVCSGNDTV